MLSFVGLCLLLGFGHLLRMKIRLLQRLYLPSCVIAGLLGLAVLQISQATGHPLGAEWTLGWSKLPGILINVVFACLFLGVRLPKFRSLARRAGPQLAYGQVVAWGQYVVGIGLFMLVVSRFWPELPAMFGAIVPVGFEGGHGTAGGLETTFDKLGWSAGKDFGLASATVGIVSAIIVGMALVNWAARRGYTVRKQSPADIPEDDSFGVIPVDQRPPAGRLTVRSDAVEAFSLHLVVVGVAVGIGYLLHAGLVALAGAIGNETFIKIATSFPKFPLCMIGGLIVQICEDNFDRHQLIDLGLTRRIQNTSLDFLVVAAVATIRLTALAEGWVPFVMICAAGILWNVLCLLVLARWMLPNAWFERSIAEMGQSMGVTATGLVLLRVVDPDAKTPAMDAFGSKQLLHEPFMGGGLWTSAAIPLLAAWGARPVFVIACGAVAAWLVIVTGVKLATRGSRAGA